MLLLKQAATSEFNAVGELMLSPKFATEC